ncbi:MAG TPA: prephenate dehydratase, partial [Chromatiaceae bacterium]|nr:prephenate dehydratase [Chromatiaceae bacterium]
MVDEDKLAGVRQRIDTLDEQIQELISRRAEAAQEVARVKLKEDPEAHFYRP